VAVIIKRKSLTSTKLRHVAVPLMGAALMAYFAYHAVQGDRGLIAWWKLRYQIEKTELTRAEVEAEKQALEQRVSLLRPESLDPDMLEERARLMLGYVHADDRVIPLPPAPPAPRNDAQPSTP
jgi:cell division protein FtsB